MIIAELNNLKKFFRRAELIAVPGSKDDHGQLNYMENQKYFPNKILRSFWISGVAKGEIRGSHAHFKESQVIVAVSGELWVRVEGLDQSVTEFHLSKPDEALFVPPLNWVEVSFGAKAVLLGLSDREFSEKDYIRDKNDFVSLQKGEI
jgi:hypothetical protein